MFTFGLLAMFCVGAGDECFIDDIPQYDLSSYAFWEEEEEV